MAPKPFGAAFRWSRCRKDPSQLLTLPRLAAQNILGTRPETTQKRDLCFSNQNKSANQICLLFLCSPSSSTNARKRSPSNSMTHTNVTLDARPLHCQPTTLDHLTTMNLMAPATHIPLHHWQNIASPPHHPDSQIHLRKL